MPAWGWPLAVWINAVVVGVPCVLLALLAHHTGGTRDRARLVGGGARRSVSSDRSARSRSCRTRSTWQCWAVVATVLAVGLAVWCARVAGRTPSRLWYAAAAGLAMLLPWLWVGALGGLLETAAGRDSRRPRSVLLAAVLGGSGRRCRFPDRHREPAARRSRRSAYRCWCWPPAPAGPACNLAVDAGAAGAGVRRCGAGPGPARGRRTGRDGGASVRSPSSSPTRHCSLLGFHDVGYWALIGAAVAAGHRGGAGRRSRSAGAAVPRTGKRSWPRRLAPVARPPR